MADPLFQNVALLVGFDEGLPGNTTFRDWSNYNRAITAIGNARMSSTERRHGAGSLYLDGTGSSISVAHDPVLVGNQDFCVECWIRPAAAGVGVAHCIASKRASNREWSFNIGSDGRVSAYAFTSGGATLVSPAIVGDSNNAIVAADVWSHVSLSKTGTTWRVGVNGILVRQGVESGTYGVGTGPLVIGNEPGFSGRAFNGHIDDVRYTAGHARYLSFPYEVPGPLGAWDIGGNVTKETGGPADRVVLHFWDTMQLARVIVPDTNGDWSAQVPQGEYAVTYLAADCQPVTHGPYLVEADA
ncbi:LamG domain-containing protein [Chitinibacteraceae bacterium HSL-7]